MMTTSNFSMRKNFKLQAPSSREAPNSKHQVAARGLGAWGLVLHWSLGFGALEIDRQLLGILDALFHGHQKRDGFFSVYSTVIVAQREIHHRTNLDFLAHRDRSLLNRMHPENPALWRIDDRRAPERAINAGLRNSEYPAP